MKGEEWNAENIPDQTETVVAVTGSSSGIGYETARVLANKNAEVIIAVRNLDKGHAAARKIRSQYPKANETQKAASITARAGLWRCAGTPFKLPRINSRETRRSRPGCGRSRRT